MNTVKSNVITLNKTFEIQKILEQVLVKPPHQDGDIRIREAYAYCIEHNLIDRVELGSEGYVPNFDYNLVTSKTKKLQPREESVEARIPNNWERFVTNEEKPVKPIFVIEAFDEQDEPTFGRARTATAVKYHNETGDFLDFVYIILNNAFITEEQWEAHGWHLAKMSNKPTDEQTDPETTEDVVNMMRVDVEMEGVSQLSEPEQDEWYDSWFERNGRNNLSAKLKGRIRNEVRGVLGWGRKLTPDTITNSIPQTYNLFFPHDEWDSSSHICYKYMKSSTEQTTFDQLFRRYAKDESLIGETVYIAACVGSKSKATTIETARQESREAFKLWNTSWMKKRLNLGTIRRVVFLSQTINTHPEAWEWNDALNDFVEVPVK